MAVRTEAANREHWQAGASREAKSRGVPRAVLAAVTVAGSSFEVPTFLLRVDCFMSFSVLGEASER